MPLIVLCSGWNLHRKDLIALVLFAVAWIKGKEDGSLGRLINHGIPGNIKPKLVSRDGSPKILFYAMCDIPQGTQLLYHYQETRPEVLQKLPWLQPKKETKTQQVEVPKSASADSICQHQNLNRHTSLTEGDSVRTLLVDKTKDMSGFSLNKKPSNLTFAKVFALIGKGNNNEDNESANGEGLSASPIGFVDGPVLSPETRQETLQAFTAENLSSNGGGKSLSPVGFVKGPVLSAETDLETPPAFPEENLSAKGGGESVSPVVSVKGSVPSAETDLETPNGYFDPLGMRSFPLLEQWLLRTCIFISDFDVCIKKECSSTCDSDDLLEEDFQHRSEALSDTDDTEILDFSHQPCSEAYSIQRVGLGFHQSNESHLDTDKSLGEPGESDRCDTTAVSSQNKTNQVSQVGSLSDKSSSVSASASNRGEANVSRDPMPVDEKSGDCASTQQEQPKGFYLRKKKPVSFVLHSDESSDDFSSGSDVNSTAESGDKPSRSVQDLDDPSADENRSSSNEDGVELVKVQAINPKRYLSIKRDWSKKSACLFCCKIMREHLLKAHQNEERVKEILDLPLRSEERRQAISRIRSEGDFKYKQAVLKSKKGVLLLKKRTQRSISPSSTQSCQYCGNLYQKDTLYKHTQNCKSKPEGGKVSSRGTKVFSSNPSDYHQNVFKDFIVKGMTKEDEIKASAIGDDLICDLGENLVDQFSADQNQFGYIRNVVRSIGRFLIEVKKIDPSIKNLRMAIHHAKYDTCVQAALAVAGYDPANNRFETPSNAKRIGEYLEKVAALLLKKAISEQDQKLRQVVNDFIVLREKDWSGKVSGKASLQMKKSRFNAPDALPDKEDVEKLADFLHEKLPIAIKNLEETPTAVTYTDMTVLLLAATMAFNRKRPGDVDKMLDSSNPETPSKKRRKRNSSKLSVRKKVHKGHNTDTDTSLSLDIPTEHGCDQLSESHVCYEEDGFDDSSITETDVTDSSDGPSFMSETTTTEAAETEEEKGDLIEFTTGSPNLKTRKKRTVIGYAKKGSRRKRADVDPQKVTQLDDDDDDEEEIVVIDDESVCEQESVTWKNKNVSTALHSETETVDSLAAPETLNEGVKQLKDNMILLLPDSWTVDIVNGEMLRLVSLNKSENAAVDFSIFWLNFNVGIYVHNLLVTTGHKICSKVASPDKQNIGSIADYLMRLAKTLSNSNICLGVTEFQKFWSDHDGVIDNYNLNKDFECLRSKECGLLIIDEDRGICKECQFIFEKIKRRKRKLEKEECQFKSDKEKAAHYQKMYRAEKRKTSRLKKRVDNLLVKLSESLHDDFTQVLSSTHSKMTDAQKIFWESQKKAISSEDRRGLRWHPLMIRIALFLQGQMTTEGYEFLRENFVQLPSQRRLYDYTHFIEAKEGCQVEILQDIKAKIDKCCPNDHFSFVNLMFDEMNELEELQSSLSKKVFQPKLAKKVLVYLAKGITSHVKTVVAVYSTDDLTSIQLYSRTWNAIYNLEENGIKVLTLTCDGAAINRKFIRMHKAFHSDSRYTYSTTNLAAGDYRPLKTRQLWKNGEYLSWKVIEAVYDHTKANKIVISNKLSKAHIKLTSFSCMKVNLACQVLSNSVASSIENLPSYLTDYDTVEVTKFIKLMNRFFDCVNGKKKEEPSPNYFEDWKNYIVNRQGIFSKTQKGQMIISHQSLEALEITVKGFIRASKFVLNCGAEEIYANVFNQDPLEQYFGSVRRKLGDNKHPFAKNVLDSRLRAHQQAEVADALQSRKGNVTGEKR
ncbi:Transposable element P transposase [Frankliniella fusca]|uniref:Transposable element P transposase n=1 Tax=Frankliniella fusca TaxID=407009 RepID=A0AAE1LGK5_9NEOP|nr:Transposable element P transposase [Frankliniella fusca]